MGHRAISSMSGPRATLPCHIGPEPPRLLVVDGASFRILRYGPDRQWLGEWGDGGVRAALQAQQAAIGWWRAGYYASLAGAVLWFVLRTGLCAARPEDQAQAQLRAHRPDLAPAPLRHLGIAGQTLPRLGSRHACCCG